MLFPSVYGDFTCRYYVWNSDSGRLENAPFVDISYKWAGGGLFSNASDLCRLGSALLYCYQKEPSNNVLTIRSLAGQNPASNSLSRVEQFNCELPLLLKPQTVSAMWMENVCNISQNNLRLGYGLGWCVQREGAQVKGGKNEPFCVGHTGAAVGASSVLLILPYKQPALESRLRDDIIPCGVVVAILFNLQEVHGMFSLGSRIAKLFYQHHICPNTTI